ncbi:hypothetical protein N0V95_004091 [Ascochyta clinopodiicola]|nr:hypothetical protein N0V95_004091 [Ascochyta clinopodiicola]
MAILSCLAFGLLTPCPLSPLAGLFHVSSWSLKTTKQVSSLELYEQQIEHARTSVNNLAVSGGTLFEDHVQFQVGLRDCLADNTRKNEVIDGLTIEVNTTRIDYEAAKFSLQSEQYAKESLHTANKAIIDDLVAKLDGAQVMVQVMHANMTDLEMANEKLLERLEKAAEGVRRMAEIGSMF